MIDKTEDEVPSKEEKKRGSETQEENQGSSGRGRGHSAGRHRHRSLGLSREPSGASQKHHEEEFRSQRRMNGKASIMNCFLKKFNDLKRNNKQVTQKQSSEYIYDTGIPSQC